MEPNKYASVQALVNLPEKRPLKKTETIFLTKEENQNHHKIPTNLKANRNELLNIIESNIKVFDDTSYEFKFPQSKFDDVPKGERNTMTFELKIEREDEDTFKPKLTSQQISQMKEKGEFEVSSSYEHITIPYVWKVNDFLLRGKVNIIEIWENGLASCYDLLIRSTSWVLETVPNSCNRIIRLPSKLFAVIFGKKSIEPVYTPDYQFEVLNDFWKDIFSNELKDIKDQIGHSFMDLLYLEFEPAIFEQIDRSDEYTNPEKKRMIERKEKKVMDYNNKKNKITGFLQRLVLIETNFERDWAKIRKRVLAKIESEIPEQVSSSSPSSESNPLLPKNESTSLISEKVEEEKYLLYIAHLKQHLPQENLSLKALEALLHIVSIFYLVTCKTVKKDKRLAEIRAKCEAEVKKQFKIRSRNYTFLEKETQRLYAPYEKAINKEFEQTLFTTAPLLTLFSHPYPEIYQKYLTLKANFNSLIEAKKTELRPVYKSQRIFKSTYLLLPPYTIIEDSNYGSKYYSLKKEQVMTIETNTNFWKIKLYLMRLKCWTINCVVTLMGLAWVGPYGLRCLFGTKEFAYDETYDSIENKKRNVYRKTFIGHFLKVIEGVKKSRKAFEDLPDRGLLGKNFSRYINYIECYLFRFVLSGILGTLIIYPILIIVLSTLSIVLVLTVWMWIPIVMFICYLFNILIFEFESNIYGRGFNIKGVPLISLVFRIAFHLLKILFSIINFLIVTPVLCLIYLIFLMIQRGFRTITDIFMILIISKLGRTPSKDTGIAKKISGPGMSRNHFFSVIEEDVYVLTQCCLEKKLLNKFTELTRVEIGKSYNEYLNMMEYVLSPFGFREPNNAYQSTNAFSNNRNELLRHFESSVGYHLMRYPMYPRNVRFTQEEIDVYFENSLKIVQNFVEKEKLKDWIFDENHVLYEDYDELTRLVWMEIFQCGEAIFEPLETLDSRFELANHLKNNRAVWQNKVDHVMESLRGEVELSKRVVRFIPGKKSILSNDHPIYCIANIYSNYNLANDRNYNIPISDPKFVLTAPRNLESVKLSNSFNKDYVLKSVANPIYDVV